MRRIPLALVVVLASLTVATAPSGAATGNPRPVVLVPVGDVGVSSVQRAASVLRKELGLRVRVTGKIAVPARARDAKRKQVVANRLLEQLRLSVSAARDGRSAVIGLTTDDMFPLNTGWNWAFAYRAGPIGIVSLARMDDATFGLDPNPGLLARRMHKYIVRYGALLALSKAETSDPRSLLYDSIVSTEDLDFMEPQLAPPPLTAARRQWLRSTEVGCHAAGQTWDTVLTALDTATVDQVPALLTQWSEADAALASRISTGAVGAPTAQARVLTAALRQRSTYLRSLQDAPLPLSDAQSKQVRSLHATIRSAMLEMGSKTCASET
jgi:predicted Zn-dependent protease